MSLSCIGSGNPALCNGETAGPPDQGGPAARWIGQRPETACMGPESGPGRDLSVPDTHHHHAILHVLDYGYGEVTAQAEIHIVRQRFAFETMKGAEEV